MRICFIHLCKNYGSVWIARVVLGVQRWGALRKNGHLGHFVRSKPPNHRLHLAGIRDSRDWIINSADQNAKRPKFNSLSRWCFLQFIFPTDGGATSSPFLIPFLPAFHLLIPAHTPAPVIPVHTPYLPQLELYLYCNTSLSWPCHRFRRRGLIWAIIGIFLAYTLSGGDRYHIPYKNNMHKRRLP